MPIGVLKFESLGMAQECIGRNVLFLAAILWGTQEPCSSWRNKLVYMSVHDVAIAGEPA